MSFASIHFIFLFLPAVLLLFYSLPYKNWRNAILVLGSLVFFGWADPAHLPPLFGLVLLNYGFARLIGSAADGNKKPAARIYMWTAVTLNIGILCFYKYLGFFGETLQALISLQFNIVQQVLPLGISYITFSGIAYIVDIYNGVEKPERNILRFSAYLMMFPKLIQGPITRYNDLKSELLNPHAIPEDVMSGARQFIIGLAKKILLADGLAIAANKVFAADFTQIGAGVAWYGLIAYTLQIYFDFSGYTDMALGLGKIFGFSLPENFNYPYISRSVTDFWRRWHMSLTRWFRAYLFFPLERARIKGRILNQPANVLIVFLLTGLWHGPSWNYVIWGGYFGLILVAESGGFGKKLQQAPLVIQHIYTLFLIMLGWVFFRITSIPEQLQFFASLFGANGWQGAITLRTLDIVFYFPIIIAAIILSLPLYKTLAASIERRPMLLKTLTDFALLGVFVLVISFILSNGFTSFMYAQF